MLIKAPIIPCFAIRLEDKTNKNSLLAMVLCDVILTSNKQRYLFKVTNATYIALVNIMIDYPSIYQSSHYKDFFFSITHIHTQYFNIICVYSHKYNSCLEYPCLSRVFM